MSRNVPAPDQVLIRYSRGCGLARRGRYLPTDGADALSARICRCVPHRASRNPGRVIDDVHRCLPVKHECLRSEQAYTDCPHRFILAKGKRHPQHHALRLSACADAKIPGLAAVASGASRLLVRAAVVSPSATTRGHCGLAPTCVRHACCCARNGLLG